MTEKFSGGKFGYQSISVKPSGEISNMCEYYLAVLRKVLDHSLSGKIVASWPNTLTNTKEGTELLALLTQVRTLEKQMKKVLDSAYDKNNEMEFIIDSQDTVKGITDNFLDNIGLGSPEETPE